MRSAAQPAEAPRTSCICRPRSARSPHINVVGLSFTDYQQDVRASRTTIFLGVWIQDIPHPHSWVVPYLTGTYAGRQRLPIADQDYFTNKMNTCLPLLGSAARACYEDIQASVHLSATALYLAQTTSTHFVRAELRGYYANLARYNFPYF